MTANDNRIAGQSFERLFEKQCLLAGLWAEPNHIKARRAWKGKLQALPSNLDYTIISKTGRVGYFDCKNFDADFFVYSDLSPHQVALALRYNACGVPAGFVVLFANGAVVFFSGQVIAHLGPGTRFTWHQGVHLGAWPDFDPRTLLSWSSGSLPDMVR